MENISTNITWGEATASATAKAKGIINVPDAATIKRMKLTATMIFQKVRDHFGKPLKVTSFYRSPALNKAIGGSTTSQHCLGEAIDMDGDVYGSPSNKQIFEFIRDNLTFDQLIVEGIYNRNIAWIHASYKTTGNRNKIMFMYVRNGKTVYENYSLKRYKELVD